ncbi:MAG: hypothetical protein FWF49_00805 [Oscillospiraceae bacterium]|nr:hypothetical protein [Oscillospiraceae bacterium]
MGDITMGTLSIDCREPERLRDFYAALVGGEKGIKYDCPALTADGLVLLFMGGDFDYIPPVWPEEPGKQQKQMHLDFTVDDLSYAVEKAICLGAVKAPAQYGGEDCITMFNPEGHPFCLLRRAQEKSTFDLYYEKKGWGRIPNLSVNIDCPNFTKLRAFYAQLTDWDPDFHPSALIPENRVIVHFMESDFDYIPPVWPEQPGKQQKQMHFDFGVDDLPAAVERALVLGATKSAIQYGGDLWVTLCDPVGHPFCLCRAEN